MVIIGAVSDLVLDALSRTLDLFAIGLEDGDSRTSLVREDQRLSVLSPNPEC